MILHFRLPRLQTRASVKFECVVSVNSFTQSRVLTTHREKPSENIVRKRENASYQHFLLLPQCFILFPNSISNFDSYLYCRLQGFSNLTSLIY